MTSNQIKEILNIIEKNIIVYTVSNIGDSILSDYDKELLKNYGIDIDKIKTDYTPFEQSFYFGQLSQILGDENTRKLGYNDFMKYLHKGQYHPLNDREKIALDIAKNRTYGHLKKLGVTQSEYITGKFIEDSQKRLYKEDVIRREIAQGIMDRRGVASVMSEIGKKTGDWNRDWGRIVDTESNNIFQEARALQIIRDKGEDVRVYKDVFQGACRHCIRLYLTNGLGSQPIIFKLSDLIANGSNIGRKQIDWVATLGGIHPWCRCTLHEFEDGMVWSDEKKMFVFSNKWERKVHIEHKDKITIGDKIIYV